MTTSPSSISVQLQPLLPVFFANFARQHSYGYASSQELTNNNRQEVVSLLKGNK